MQALRWVIAAFIILNAVAGVLLALRAVALKRHVRVRSGMPAVNALLATLSWPLVTLWLASMTAFLASAVLLVLGDAAAMVTFVLALALNLATVWKAHEAIHGGSSKAGEILSRCVLFGLLFLAGNGSGRRPPTRRLRGRGRIRRMEASDLDVHRNLPRRPGPRNPDQPPRSGTFSGRQVRVEAA